MKHERRQDNVKGLACQKLTQIADVAVDHARSFSQAFACQGDHFPAAVHGNNARPLASQPIGVPAMATTGVENILAVHIGEKSERRRALVERVPRSVVDLCCVMSRDAVVISWANHRRLFALGCPYSACAAGRECLRTCQTGAEPHVGAALAAGPADKSIFQYRTAWHHPTSHRRSSRLNGCEKGQPCWLVTSRRHC